MSVSNVALLTSGGLPPVWSSPMTLKHLDVVRSDVDGEMYKLLNNNPVAQPITVGPGNPATAADAWTAGWRKIGDTDVPGDVIVVTDTGNNPVITKGVKKYLRTGYLIEGTPEQYPALPLNAFSVFKHWVAGSITDPPTITTALAIGGVDGISSGPNAGVMLAVSGATSSVADANKHWTSLDFGKSWVNGGTWSGTNVFNRRIASNGYDRIYVVTSAQQKCAYFYKSGTNLFINYAGSHELTLGTNFATGALEYVGSSGAKPATDCLILLNPERMVTGPSPSISVSVDGGLTFTNPSFTPYTADMKPVMALSNKQGHVIILGASKASDTPGIKCWSNNTYASGTWNVSFETPTHYNVCGGCWDGEKYVIAIQSATGVDIAVGIIQPGGDVIFTQVSTASLAAYITGDGHKNSGNGLYAYKDQYLLRMTNKLSIFPSFGALCDAVPTAIAPLQGATVLNSVGFAKLGDRCVGFTGNAPWSSRLTIGSVTPAKDNPDFVQAMRVQ